MALLSWKRRQKGEIAQLIFVTVVYFAACKSGYNTAQAKAASVGQEFTGPVTDLLDRLHETVDRAAEAENKK